MESAARRSGGGLFEGLYKVLMRRNSVYVTFVILGAFAGERAVDYGVKKLWESNNVGTEKESIMPEKKGSISARVHLQSSVVADAHTYGDGIKQPTAANALGLKSGPCSGARKSFLL